MARQRKGCCGIAARTIGGPEAEADSFVSLRIMRSRVRAVFKIGVATEGIPPIHIYTRPKSFRLCL